MEPVVLAGVELEMSLAARLRRIGIDTYLLLLAGTVLLATILPVSGDAAVVVKAISLWAVALLFFLYGAKLDTAAVIAGIANWRLQGLVFLTTYLAFPILGVVLALALAPWLGSTISTGLLFLAVLPSTVNSSIAFTGMAQGNVPAAVCAASVSNLVGVFLTPLLAALLLHTNGGGGINVSAVGSIAMQILLPFALGQALHKWIGAWISRHKPLTLVVDRGAILLIVYSAFSAGMVAGIWQQVDLGTLAVMIVADCVLLAAIMLGVLLVARLTGLSYADRMTLLFCGSTKSLASGVPMASILFVGLPVSLIILPLMLFHQIQLFVCAIIAQRSANEIALAAAQ